MQVCCSTHDHDIFCVAWSDSLITKKAAKLSWDTFPEPPPEAESWQPDPDCIPVAGDPPDLRFNRHPLTEMHKMALQCDRRFELANDGLITSAGIGSPTTSTSSKTTPSGISSWSMPLPRETGSSHAFASVPRKEARHPISAPAQTSRTVQAASPIMFPVQPPPHQLQTPIVSIVLQKPDSFTNSPTPAWACLLTRLLSESSSKPVPSDRSSSVQGRSTALPSVSIPPHLCKQVRSSTPVTSRGSSSERLLNQANGTVSSAMKPERSVTPVFKHTNVIGQEEVTKECETSLLQHPTETEVKPTKLVEVGTISYGAFPALTKLGVQRAENLVGRLDSKEICLIDLPVSALPQHKAH